MKDKWMNMGYEDDELKPYLEPEPDYKDHKRIGESASMYITLPTYLICKLCNSFFSDLFTQSRVCCFHYYNYFNVLVYF